MFSTAVQEAASKPCEAMLAERPRVSILAGAYVLLIISLILYRLNTTVADTDLWGYLAFGRLYWEQGNFPYIDVYSYVPTLNLWVYHEWLTGVLFYPLYKNFGGFGLQVFKYLVGLATLWLIYLTARCRGGAAWVAGLIVAMLAGGFRSGFSPVRAQVFSYFFFACTLFALENYRQNGDRKNLWLLSLIFMPWANLHGGFVAGLGLIGLFALGESFAARTSWPYMRCLGLATLVTLINPYGWHYWTYLIKALAMPRPEISEWASIYTAFSQGTYGPTDLLYVFAIVIFSLLVIRRQTPKDITSLIILGVTLAVSVKNIRNLPFFLLAAGVYLPEACKHFEKDLKIRFSAGLSSRLRVCLTTFFLGTSLFLLALFFKPHPFSLEIPAAPQNTGSLKFYPVEVIRSFQANQISGNLLVHFDWGEYALWNLYPNCRIAIDGRYETVYPDAVCQEYFDFIQARDNWQDFLRHFPPDFILLPTDTKIAALVQKTPGWKAVFSGNGCILFKK